MINRNTCVGALGLALTALLAGCVGNVTVPISLSTPVAEKAESRSHALVKVHDIRKKAAMERTTIGELSMGKITLTPPIPELVKTLVQEKADAVLARRAAQVPLTVLCGIRQFDVTTPATILYWDVTTKIELVLRVGEQDRNVLSIATERTYVYPSDAMIQRVTQEALAKVGSEVERALAELILATP